MKRHLLAIIALLTLAQGTFAYRDLETGTFLTRDPIGYADGPNVYCYVRCNPITKFDAFGLKLQVVGGDYDSSSIYTQCLAPLSDTLSFDADSGMVSTSMSDPQTQDSVDAIYTVDDVIYAGDGNSPPSGISLTLTPSPEPSMSTLDSVLSTIINSSETYTIIVGNAFGYNAETRTITVPAENTMAQHDLSVSFNPFSKKSAFSPLSFSSSTAHELGHAEDHDNRPGVYQGYVDEKNNPAGRAHAYKHKNKMEDRSVKVEDAARVRNGERQRGYYDNQPTILSSGTYKSEFGKEPESISLK